MLQSRKKGEVDAKRVVGLVDKVLETETVEVVIFGGVLVEKAIKNKNKTKVSLGKEVEGNG